MKTQISWGNLMCVLLLLFMGGNLYSGTTGKIAGTITDKNAGNALPGTNVVVQGTQMGAAADAQGNFTILHVPPGVYDLQFTMMGYAVLTVQDLRVRVDQTTRFDAILEEEAIVGDVVTVVAEKNNIKPDVATSVITLGSDEVENLPITSIDQVVELQAGVESGMKIRGGESDQSLFMVDGITLRDPRNNRPITGIALSSIKEISVERGGFNAEYGQVRSGIINVIRKEGDRDRYSGSLTVKYANPQQKHFGISPFDRNSMWLRPYFDDDVCWTGTSNGNWDTHVQQQYPKFEGWNKISDRLMSDDDPGNDVTPVGAQQVFMWETRKKPINDQPDYNIDAGFGGPVPFLSDKLGGARFFASYKRDREMLIVPISIDDYVNSDFSLQVTSDISNSMKLLVSGMSGYNTTMARNYEFSSYLNSAHDIAGVASERPSIIFGDFFFSPAKISYQSYAAKLTHTLSPSTYYETSIEHIRRKYDVGPGPDRDLETMYEVAPGYHANEAPFGYVENIVNGIAGMFFGGHMSLAWDKTKSSATTVKLDMTSQLNFYNLVKTGFEFVYNDMHLNYGQGRYLGNSSRKIDMQTNPYRGAFYIQDKIETKGFLVNAGVRLDFSNSNISWINPDPFNINFFTAKYNQAVSNPQIVFDEKESETQISVSPRLGVSHPITSESKLYFNYGHFKQLPSYEQVFNINRGTQGQINNYGDPNLILAKTISYELGYDHLLFNDYLIQLAAYYHDVRDQQDFTQYFNNDETVNYALATSNSYEDTRGFEFTFRKNGGKWWDAFASYTYQVTSSGHFGSQQIYENPAEQRRYDMRTSNLYQLRPLPTPYARASVIFHTPSGFGPSIAGMNLFEGWNFNFIANWRAGFWQTYNPNNAPNIANNVQANDFYNVDLHIHKNFKVGKNDFQVFIDVINALNIKRLSLASVYDGDDNILYYQSLHLPESKAYGNIPGKDRIGDYRKPGVDFQPIIQQGAVTDVANPNPETIYYEVTTETYKHFVDGAWQRVGSGRMDQILEDKAYIDMPNESSFNFLYPRQIFIGVKFNF